MSQASDWLNDIAAELGIAEEDREIKAEDEQSITDAIANGVNLDHLRRLILEPGALGEHSTGLDMQNQLITQARERLTKE